MPFKKTETISKLLEDDLVNEYLSNIGNMNKGSSKEYLTRLNIFNTFITNSCGFSISDAVKKIKDGNIDPYALLSKFSNYLLNSNLSHITVKQRIATIKNFFEYHDIEISPRKFSIKVKLPKVIKSNKEALSKEDIVEILNECSDIRLRTYVLLLASTGMRASEALSIRTKDVDFESKPAKIFLRGKYTKTKTDRIVFLTEEMKNQLGSWLNYKYRTRRNCYYDKETGKSISENKTPIKNKADLMFAVSYNHTPNIISMYNEFTNLFSKTLDRMGKGEREDGNERRRQITLHSFRRFVKTTISDLGYSDFSEWFIGHSGSTYWRKKDSEKAELFKKIEPYLTFLNIHQLERQGADIQSKIDELELINQSLRERDRSKDEAISMLSDQLVTITERLKELERRQQLH